MKEILLMLCYVMLCVVKLKCEGNLNDLVDTSLRSQLKPRMFFESEVYLGRVATSAVYVL